MNWPPEFNLIDDHCREVLTGEYDVPIDGEPVILDIGANVGAFARWAKIRWPNSVVHCYEPHPDNYALLQRTIDHYGLNLVIAYPVAVSNNNNTSPLYHNGPNCGEWSLATNAATHGEPLQAVCVDAASLPDATIIKVDTEGAEPMILSRMAQCGRLDKAQAVMLEYHARAMVDVLTNGLRGLGLKLFDHQKYSEHRGVMKFLR